MREWWKQEHERELVALSWIAATDFQSWKLPLIQLMPNMEPTVEELQNICYIYRKVSQVYSVHQEQGTSTIRQCYKEYSEESDAYEECQVQPMQKGLSIQYQHFLYSLR